MNHTHHLAGSHHRSASVASADSAITLPARAAKKYRSFGAGAPRMEAVQSAASGLILQGETRDACVA
jgi:hypothetical protein